MDTRELSDAELLSAALQGDTERFGELCERHRARVWRVAASVAHGAEADDIAQETVVRAWWSLRRYRAEASFAAWLTRIAANVAYDHRKSAWTQRVQTLSAFRGKINEGMDAEAVVLARDEQRAVRQAVADLPERERSPIWLHYFEGFTIAEIARLTGVPEATIRSRVRAGLKRLGKTLAGSDAVGRCGQRQSLPEAEQCGT